MGKRPKMKFRLYGLKQVRVNIGRSSPRRRKDVTKLHRTDGLGRVGSVCVRPKIAGLCHRGSLRDSSLLRALLGHPMIIQVLNNGLIYILGVKAESPPKKQRQWNPSHWHVGGERGYAIP